MNQRNSLMFVVMAMTLSSQSVVLAGPDWVEETDARLEHPKWVAELEAKDAPSTSGTDG